MFLLKKSIADKCMEGVDVSSLTCWFVAPPEDQEGQSEEEMLKQKTKERARKEFLGAVASEGQDNYIIYGAYLLV